MKYKISIDEMPTGNSVMDCFDYNGSIVFSALGPKLLFERPYLSFEERSVDNKACLVIKAEAGQALDIIKFIFQRLAYVR